jgi:DNA-binding response OmpR family regulator
MQLGSIEINIDKFEVKRDGVSIPLTRTEFMIRKILASNPEKVFLKEELYQKLWNDTYYDNGNALNVHIRRLRKKIEKNPEQSDHIITK